MEEKKYKIASLIKQGFTQHKELNPQIFDENQVLIKEVREKLLVIANDFIDSLGIDHIDFVDITLTGSLANYNWNPFSDIDLHVIYDYEDIDSDQDLVAEFFLAKKDVWNENHDVTIYDYDVELYGQDVNQEHYSTGVYSVFNNEWVIKPKPETYKIYQERLVEKTKSFIHMIDYVLSVPGDEKKINLLSKVKDKIKKYRQSGLEEGGEYSEENMVFKLLRRMGYLEKMSSVKHKIEDKLLSLT